MIGSDEKNYFMVVKSSKKPGIYLALSDPAFSMVLSIYVGELPEFPSLGRNLEVSPALED